MRRCVITVTSIVPVQKGCHPPKIGKYQHLDATFIFTTLPTLQAYTCENRSNPELAHE